MSATDVGVTGFDAAAGEGAPCDGKTDKPWGPLDGKVTDDTIVIDFSPKGGPSDLTGTWTPDSKRITWADGNFWPMNMIDEFVGIYFDPNHPGCTRTIKDISATDVGVTGFDGATGGGCNGKNDKPWGPLDGKVTDNTIVIDFSPKGGPSDLTGTWTPDSKRITWADGNFWP